MKVVKVLWIDSCNSNLNWTVAEDIEVEPIYINSFGVVVKDTNEFLAIAQNYGDNPEQYSNITTIPKGCIKEVFVIHEDNVYENKQKTTGWGEEDDIMKQHCHQMLALLRPNSSELTKDIIDNCHHWLKSLKNRVQPEQKWSEEDKRTLQGIIGEIEANKHHAPDCDLATYDWFLSWLKSLKERYTWKPSEEQLKSLQKAIDTGYFTSYPNSLETLYEQLKKLKGEQNYEN